jgi:hypothetical protein
MQGIIKLLLVDALGALLDQGIDQVLFIGHLIKKEDSFDEVSNFLLRWDSG